MLKDIADKEKLLSTIESRIEAHDISGKDDYDKGHIRALKLLKQELMRGDYDLDVQAIISQKDEEIDRLTSEIMKVPEGESPC